MPQDIIVNETNNNDNGWEFLVAVNGNEFTVSLKRADWERLTGGTEEPEALVRRSFQFLLAREPVSSILPSFDLTEISEYIPEYEEEIQSEDE